MSMAMTRDYDKCHMAASYCARSGGGGEAPPGSAVAGGGRRGASASGTGTPPPATPPGGGAAESRPATPPVACKYKYQMAAEYRARSGGGGRAPQEARWRGGGRGPSASGTGAPPAAALQGWRSAPSALVLLPRTAALLAPRRVLTRQMTELVRRYCPAGRSGDSRVLDVWDLAVSGLGSGVSVWVTCRCQTVGCLK